MNYWDKRSAAADKEAEGIEVEVAEFPGWKFRIGRDCPWNAEYSRALVRLSQQPKFSDFVKRSAEPGYSPAPRDEKLERELELCAFAEGILRGWSGVTDRKGAKLAFSPKAAAELLSHFAPIYLALRREARNAARFEPIAEPVKLRLAEGN